MHSALGREKEDRYDVIQKLILSGADLNARGINDWTPTHMAAVRNDLKALQILVGAGADLSIRTRIDCYATPLEEAVEMGQSPEAVAYLTAMTG